MAIGDGPGGHGPGDGGPGDGGPGDGGSATARGDGPGGVALPFRVSEDIAATIIGLAILVLILLGAIPKGILP